MLLLFAWVVGLLYNAMSDYAEVTSPPLVLCRIGFKRTPVFIGVLVWLFIALAMQEPGFHDVEVLGRTGEEQVAGLEPATPTGLDRVYEDWKARADEFHRVRSTTSTTTTSAATSGTGGSNGAKPAVPMVFVSTWGGGIRAAVWTAYVVDCAFEDHDNSRPWGSGGAAACRAVDPKAEYSDDFLFSRGSAIELMIAGSGISGGSLGLAEYVAFVVEPDAGIAHKWVKARLSDDYLSPALARLFFVDMPVSFAAAGLGSIDDRADILQQGWELSWDAERRPGVGMRRGIRDTWQALGLASSLPLVVMNSASMNDGCSINGSHVGLAVEGEEADECRSLFEFDIERSKDTTSERFAERVVGTHDVVDYLCEDEDLSLSATALMSARFPAISPSGRLAPGVRCDIKRPAIYATDGGQLELSGTLTAVQLPFRLDICDDQFHINSPYRLTVSRSGRRLNRGENLESGIRFHAVLADVQPTSFFILSDP